MAATDKAIETSNAAPLDGALQLRSRDTLAEAVAEPLRRRLLEEGIAEQPLPDVSKPPWRQKVDAMMAPKVPEPLIYVGMPGMGACQASLWFTQSMLVQQLPVRATFQVGAGRHQAICRNAICEAALECGATHVWMVDTDMQYPPDALKLQYGANVDVICGFAVSRHMYHKPIWGPAVEGRRFKCLPQWPTVSGWIEGKRLTGVQPTGRVGGAGLLIRTRVLRDLPRPWFKFEDDEQVGEDAYFSQQCLDHGVPLFCHMDVLVGHETLAVLNPQYLASGDAQGGPRWQVDVDGITRPWAGLVEDRPETKEAADGQG